MRKKRVTKIALSNKLRNRILLMVLSFTILISTLVTAFSSYLYQNFLLRNLIQTSDMNLKFMADSIDNNMENVLRLMRFGQSNTTINDFVEATTDDPLQAIQAYNRLTEEYQSNAVKAYIRRIVIANIQTGKYLQIVPASYSTSVNVAAQAPLLENFTVPYYATGYDYSMGFTTDPFYIPSNTQVLTLARPIVSRYNSDASGFIMMSLTESLFTDPLRYYALPTDSTLYLTIGDHIYLLESSGVTELSPQYELINEIDNDSLSDTAYAHEIKNTVTGDRSLLVTTPLSMTDCYISQTISPSELASEQTLYRLIIGFILFLIVVMGILLYYWLYVTINVPVRKLRKRIDSISTGDFSRDPDIEWQHELGDIGRGINTLSENVSDLLERRVEDEKQKNDLEYKMLQSQINPHFIYNTLNSIKWMATIQGADGISEMTTALSRLLRSISKGTSLMIPLKEELSFLKDYFTIQQYRYGGTISMDIQVEEESLLESEIVKFTLQPLVENSIFHGIEPKGSTGHIIVHVETVAEDVLITVFDDGVGMSPETSAKLLSENSENKSDFFKEIGVSNVHKRLQYEYGTRYGITIESVFGEYTKMKLLIPRVRTVNVN